MPFSQILSRGFAAAHGIPAGLFLYFLILGVQQGLNLIVGGMVSLDALQVQPGQEPPPELFALMGYGCFSCVLGLVALFAAPWITGGVVGQMRDLISQPGKPPGGFGDYSSRFYSRMLALAFVWLAIFAALWLVMMIVGAAIVATAVPAGEQLPSEQLQHLNWHPANIAAGIFMFLATTALGVWYCLAQPIVVVDDKGALASLGDALGFIRRNTGDVFKLYMISAILNSLLWIPGLVLAALQVEGLAIRAVIGCMVALYFPYIIMLGLAWGASLYLARRTEPKGDNDTL